MGDPDLQAAKTGLLEVLPVLDQALKVLQHEASQRQPSDIKGWSSTWSSRTKARKPTLSPILLMLDLDYDTPDHPLDLAAALRPHQGCGQQPVWDGKIMWLGFSRLYGGKLHTIWTPLSQRSVPYTRSKAVYIHCNKYNMRSDAS